MLRWSGSYIDQLTPCALAGRLCPILPSAPSTELQHFPSLGVSPCQLDYDHPKALFPSCIPRLRVSNFFAVTSLLRDLDDVRNHHQTHRIAPHRTAPRTRSRSGCARQDSAFFFGLCFSFSLSFLLVALCRDTRTARTACASKHQHLRGGFQRRGCSLVRDGLLRSYPCSSLSSIDLEDHHDTFSCQLNLSVVRALLHPSNRCGRAQGRKALLADAQQPAPQHTPDSPRLLLIHLNSA